MGISSSLWSWSSLLIDPILTSASPSTSSTEASQTVTDFCKSTWMPWQTEKRHLKKTTSLKSSKRWRRQRRCANHHQMQDYRQPPGLKLVAMRVTPPLLADRWRRTTLHKTLTDPNNPSTPNGRHASTLWRLSQSVYRKTATSLAFRKMRLTHLIRFRKP